MNRATGFLIWCAIVFMVCAVAIRLIPAGQIALARVIILGQFFLDILYFWVYHREILTDMEKPL
jgi:hypothetical protein